MIKKYSSVMALCLALISGAALLSERAHASRILLDPAGLTGSVPLRHRVIIPAIIYFRVGFADFDRVNKVVFDLNQDSRFGAGVRSYESGDVNPLGDGNEVEASSVEGGELVVDVRSNIGSIVISYTVDNVQGLSNGAGDFINYDQINTQSDDPSSLPAPTLSNNGGGIGSANSVTITGVDSGNDFGGRVVNRQSVWTYTYKNETTPVAGVYEGQVTYIASIP